MNELNEQKTAQPSRSYTGESCIPALKEKYLDTLTVHAAATGSLRTTVIALIDLGVARSELVRWAVAAGYSESHIRNLLSRLLRGRGVSRRKRGAGRKAPQEALALLALALDQHGDKAIKYLLAAYRAGKAQLAESSLRQAA